MPKIDNLPSKLDFHPIILLEDRLLMWVLTRRAFNALDVPLRRFYQR